uniref:Chemokine ligand 20a n=1 Tax=Ctenopharyngodon idella TaxID=7959 RepID=A0A345D6Z6_CTEID|nr:chemokine ligand 20a [Ctenopharyngodon idella]
MLCVMSDGPLNYACCVKYTRTPLPFKLIKGFIEQSSLENNKKVCASVEDQWVRAALARLRSKIDKLTDKRPQHLTTVPTTSSP